MVCRHAAWLVLGMGLGGCAANAAPVTLDAHVVAVAGDVAVRAGQACQVTLRPDWRQGVNCHVDVVCGGTSLFGGKRLGGYARCDTKDGAFLSAEDDRTTTQDGDPALALDRGTPRWVVKDDRPGWRVELRWGAVTAEQAALR
jgi:hypothetical protein